MSGYHEPVLAAEVVKLLQPTSGKIFVDGTAGGGGHTEALLAAGAEVYAIDTDKEAVAEVTRRLLPLYGDRLRVIAGNYKDLSSLVTEKIDGVLFDLGVSSHQLDSPGRGFSLRFDEAPLDMRLDQTGGEPVADFIKKVSAEDLYEVIALYGEEKRARAIAAAVCRARQVKPVLTVGELKQAVGKGVPGADIGTLTRVFQALRIQVNQEIPAIKAGLEGAYRVLKTGGRIGVISFHSLEDRAVKLEFNRDRWRKITKKPVVPGLAEIKVNRRSRSAKFRVAEKI